MRAERAKWNKGDTPGWYLRSETVGGSTDANFRGPGVNRHNSTSESLTSSSPSI